MSILIALLCLSLIGPTGQRAAGRQENDEILRSDTPIEHTMAAGETRKCRLSASAGEFVRVIIEYREMVGALTLLTPDGKKAAEAVIASGSFNTNQLSFIAETSGEYRLVVGTVGLLGQGAGTALPADPQTGKGYTLRIAERRAAAAPDRSRVSAERALEEADAFIRRNRAEATRGAIKKYEESLAVWRALGEKQAEAFALFRIGNAYHNLGEPNRAVEIYYQSLAIWRGLSDPRRDFERARLESAVDGQAGGGAQPLHGGAAAAASVRQHPGRGAIPDLHRNGVRETGRAAEGAGIL
jgi:tetratricopeptide (TPR) repeat protein